MHLCVYVCLSLIVCLSVCVFVSLSLSSTSLFAGPPEQKETMHIYIYIHMRT